MDARVNWTAALLAFKIHFGDRVPDNCKLTVTLLDTPGVTVTIN